MKTSQRQIFQNGGDASTCSPQASPASPSAWPDSERERTMTATSGRRLSALCVKSDPLGSLARMLLESSRWFSPARRLKWEAVPLFSTRITYTERSSSTSSKPSAKTSSVKDIPSSRLLFRLVPSERPTEGTGCGLLPTVQTQGLKRCNAEGRTEFMPLGLLPTPMGTEIRHERRVKELKKAGGQTFHSRKNGETRPNGLMDYMDFHGLLPTPTTRDYKGSVSPQGMTRKNGKNRDDMLSNIPVMVGEHCQQTGGKTSQLNPLFVEEMMGFPSMWTTLPFLSPNGEQNP